ncbi:MAG: GDP-L-fucose synthase [Bacteroidetes bacterium]|nr:GDP-L-fucose synthase [Bacteroidota bacterium]
MQKDSKIYVAGHNGTVGSAIVRKLQKDGFSNIIVRTSKELDLTNQQAVANFFSKEKPEYVFLAAAKVGGIQANNIYRADFIYQNLMIECNVIHQSYVNGVKKLLFLGSSCIYPKNAPQPIKEDYLLTSVLEQTNEPYAIAKIAGLKLCENYKRQYNCNFISAMPTNLYGPNDNYDLNNSHVLPAILRKFHEAKENHTPNMEVWGTGKPRREFLHVDDLADACMFLMNNYNDSKLVNVGYGSDVSIGELSELIKKISGYSGEITYNTSKPDGTMKKLMDSTFLNSMGWSPTIDLETGITKVYQSVFVDKTESITLR